MCQNDHFLPSFDLWIKNGYISFVWTQTTASWKYQHRSNQDKIKVISYKKSNDLLQKSIYYTSIDER